MEHRRARRGGQWKRWLYLTHRWLGIVTCLFFAVWFVSGLVMIYVPFPSLTRAERLTGLGPIDWRQVRVQPDARGARSMALEMQAARPVWRIDWWDGPQTVVAATDGSEAGRTDAGEARVIAASFGRAPVVALELVMRDQWTVAGSYERHRPLWKASLAGPGGRVLYVSSRTGAVVLDTGGRERFWNWLGSVPHWIYPTMLRQDNEVWRQVVMWVSGPCIVGAVAGMWIGILRLRTGSRRFSRGRMTPYRGWMGWHHWAGLIGGVFLIAWIFSGWLSVDPFRLFASKGIGQADERSYDSGGLPHIDLDRLARHAQGARRVEVIHAAGRALILIQRARTSDVVIDATTLDPARLDRRLLVAAARRLLPGAAIGRVELLRSPDAYWYEVDDLPVLPVLRVRFRDAAGTWVHIDPATGELLGDMDRRRRIYRWAFDLLHKWDLNVLTSNRPGWDVVLWLLSLAGMITSVTGIRIGWSRLRPNRRPGSGDRGAPRSGR
ncbi:MAG: PepSY domain-containing protein [Janthinobacterium lividum]